MARLRQIVLPQIPPEAPSEVAAEQLRMWITDALLPALTDAFQDHLHDFPETLRSELFPRTYTDTTSGGTDTRPDPDDHVGSIIYISNGAAGGRWQGSHGGAWINLG